MAYGLSPIRQSNGGTVRLNNWVDGNGYRIAATAPSARAQNIRCPTGASIFPPDVKLSTTNDPESDEVTKKLVINKIAIKFKTIE